MSSLTFENQRETLVIFLNSISRSDGRIDQFCSQMTWNPTGELASTVDMDALAQLLSFMKRVPTDYACTHARFEDPVPP